MNLETIASSSGQQVTLVLVHVKDAWQGNVDCTESHDRLAVLGRQVSIIRHMVIINISKGIQWL